MKKIGFLGGGRIASALAGGFLAGGFAKKEDILVFDCLPGQSENFANLFGVTTATSPEELASSCDALFLCVKPGDVEAALESLVRVLPNRLLISVAAGVSLRTLCEASGGHDKICRAMPNTAAEVRMAATALCFTDGVGAEERAWVEGAFEAVGEAFVLPEKQFDAVVGVSGSGPAYAFLLIEAMSDGATKAGLPRPIARRLAALAVRGAAALVLETGRHPAELRESVSSPGGTTLEALEELEKGGVRSHVARAVQAAARRSGELSANS